MSPRSLPGDYLKPLVLFLATLLTVFVCEVAVMFVLDLLPELPLVGEAFLDACLLSLLVVPFLYWLFLKPFLSNIAEHRKAESECQKIAALDRMKSEFVSTAAHELRTPLATIMGYSELLLDEQRFDAGQRREFIALIFEKAGTMDRLIDDLLDLNRIEKGQPLQIRKDRHDIVATLAALLEEYRKKHPARPIRAALPAEPLVFAFDRVRVEQVVDNLLGNAIKFSAADAPIDIAGELDGENFLIAVRDHGIGISPKDMPHVFDKFYRADMSNTAPTGMGLGMAIAREIVALHGGRIWLESAPEQGTIAYFTLPVTPGA